MFVPNLLPFFGVETWHCMVQIDEERVAIMGGKNSNHDLIREVDIYDFTTNDWSEGPR